MVTALLLFKPCSSYYSGFGMSPGQKACIYISTASLPELKELGKYRPRPRLGKSEKTQYPR